jgi:hypothetical protein
MIKTENVGVVGIRYTIIRRASAAGYISPLSSLEERNQKQDKEGE